MQLRITFLFCSSSAFHLPNPFFFNRGEKVASRRRWLVWGAIPSIVCSYGAREHAIKEAASWRGQYLAQNGECMYIGKGDNAGGGATKI